MPEPKVCSRCQQGGLHWQAYGSRFRLADELGQPHVCLVTKASQLLAANPTPSVVSPAPSISAEVQRLARDAVLDTVATVTESFQRNTRDRMAELDLTMRTWTRDTEDRVASRIQALLDQAKYDLQAMIPQRHELVVRTPDAITILRDTRPHQQLGRLVEWLNLREHTWLAGPAGSGKSTGAEQAAQVLKLPMYTLNCGMATNDWSLLGFISPTGQYIPGHLRQPFEHGGVFILDEIDNTNPSVLTTINGALSARSYTFPDTIVPRHPDFVVVGCANTWGTGPDRQYVGRNQLDAATLDRFRKITWGYDEEAEYDWAGRDQGQWVAFVQEVRAEATKLAMRVVISPRASIIGAKALRNGMAWDDTAQECIWNGMSPDDSTRLQSTVGGGRRG